MGVRGGGRAGGDEEREGVREGAEGTVRAGPYCTGEQLLSAAISFTICRIV